MKLLLIFLMTSVVVTGWWLWYLYLQNQEYVRSIHDRLDELDPYVRALSAEEEVEREALMNELRELGES